MLIAAAEHGTTIQPPNHPQLFSICFYLFFLFLHSFDLFFCKLGPILWRFYTLGQIYKHVTKHINNNLMEIFLEMNWRGEISNCYFYRTMPIYIPTKFATKICPRKRNVKTLFNFYFFLLKNQKHEKDVDLEGNFCLEVVVPSHPRVSLSQSPLRLETREGILIRKNLYWTEKFFSGTELLVWYTMWRFGA